MTASRQSLPPRRAAGARSPGLATVLVGDDPASHVYVANKRKACEQAGIRSIHHELAAGAPPEELIGLVRRLDADSEVDGILVQMPLPAGHDTDAVLAEISASKDVDGLTPTNAGLLAQGKIGVAEALELEDAAPPAGLVACTPSGVMELLRVSGIELEGAEAVIVGRSTLVGRPLASLLLAANATVSVAHSRTRDLAETCRRADVLVAAVGVPALIEGSLGQAGRDRDRRRHQPHRGRPGRRRRLRRRGRDRRRDHPGSGRRRPDDDRDAAGEHGSGRARKPHLTERVYTLHDHWHRHGGGARSRE